MMNYRKDKDCGISVPRKPRALIATYGQAFHRGGPTNDVQSYATRMGTIGPVGHYTTKRGYDRIVSQFLGYDQIAGKRDASGGSTYILRVDGSLSYVTFEPFQE